ATEAGVTECAWLAIILRRSRGALTFALGVSDDWQVVCRSSPRPLVILLRIRSFPDQRSSCESISFEIPRNSCRCIEGERHDSFLSRSEWRTHSDYGRPSHAYPTIQGVGH